MPTRRHFLQWAGAGAAISLAARNGFCQATASAEQQPTRSAAKRAYRLGLASYTLHRYPLDETLAIANRVGLKHICLHPKFHLLVDGTPEQIAQTVAKTKAAGLDLYASGVITMQTPEQVNRVFGFAKTAGLRVIVGVPVPEVLPLVNEKVQEYDIRVAIHNHGPLQAMQHNTDHAIGTADHHPIGTGQRRKLARNTFTIGLVTGRTGEVDRGAAGEHPFLVGLRIFLFYLSHGYVGRIDLRAEIASLVDQVQVGPHGHDTYQGHKPRGKARSRTHGRFSGIGYVSTLRSCRVPTGVGGIHFNGGASNKGVSARKLRR